MTRPVCLLAFGGNAILREGEQGTHAEQQRNSRLMVQTAMRLYAGGALPLIVHGNGPQVGNVLLRVEEAITKVPPDALDVCVAATQGTMAYLLEVEIRTWLARRQGPTEVASLVTMVEVELSEEERANPSKPIGPYYDAYRAQALRKQARWPMREIPGHGWRRVVPSPRPLRVLQRSLIRSLVEAGTIVVAGGGAASR